MKIIILDKTTADSHGVHCDLPLEEIRNRFSSIEFPQDLEILPRVAAAKKRLL